MMIGQGKKLQKLFRSTEEWKLRLFQIAGLSIFVAALACIGVAALVVSFLRSHGGLIPALQVGLLLLDILLVAAAAAGYIFVSSRGPRPSQLHFHGLSLVIMLISYTGYTVSKTLHPEEMCALWSVANFASLLFFGLYKAVFFVLIRKRMKALGPPISCCVRADSWGRAAVVFVLATGGGGGLIYAWGAILALRGVSCEEFNLLLNLELTRAKVPVADKAFVLSSLAVTTIGIVGSIITGFGMVYSSWRLTRRAISKLIERQVPAKELSNVKYKLRLHLLGVVIGFSSTQLALFSGFVADLGLLWKGGEESWFAQTVISTIDCVGDVIGILLLSGIGVLLIQEDPTAGDVSGHIRGLLHSAVLTSRAQMAFEGCVDRRSKFCVVSFPGKYLEDWHALTWACEQGDLSSACVFLPMEDPLRRFGTHVASPSPGKCWCYSIYGKDLGSADLWDGIGLGGSQKGEVAYLRMRGLHVLEEDLGGLRRRFTKRPALASAV